MGTLPDDLKSGIMEIILRTPCNNAQVKYTILIFFLSNLLYSILVEFAGMIYSLAF